MQSIEILEFVLHTVITMWSYVNIIVWDSVQQSNFFKYLMLAPLYTKSDNQQSYM